MAAPKNVRLKADFDEWFPQGLFLVGEIAPVMEYQSQEDRARNRPVRPRIDEATGFPLYKGTFADPAAEKEREKSSRWSSPALISRCHRKRLLVCRFGRWCWKT
jgi:hypothetical protein